MKKKQIDDDAALVVGLDRFGTVVASTLDGLGREVLAIEHDSVLVQQWSRRFRIIEGDATSTDVLEQVGARESGMTATGIGSSPEVPILATANLADPGMKQVWAKVTSCSHGRILRYIGAHHVIHPKYDAGVRVAHMVSGKTLDYIEMEDGFSIIKMRPSRDIQGFTMTESKVCERFGVTITGAKASGQPPEYAIKEAKIGSEDVIIVSGDSAPLEEFANR